ncbi:MAG: ribosome silencing factor [Spirochaetes bacterium]|nr:ribosome silencing factor [Spirochaetota bacterium]
MTLIENGSGGEIIKICLAGVRVLDEKKAFNTILLDLREVNSYLDYFLITSGNSKIHCRSLARELQKAFIGLGLRLLNKPDLDSGWIILDFGELIIHVFTEEIRYYYNLEKLWADARRIV